MTPSLATQTLAAETAAKPEQWLQIEVVVFQQTDAFDDEGSRHDIELYYPKNIIKLTNPDLDTVAPATLSDKFYQDSPSASEASFVQLAKTERNLNQYARSLSRSARYRVLYHQAWRQPKLAPDAAPWIFLNGGERYGEHFELEGSIRIILSRFYHAETNLWLTKFVPEAAQEATLSPTLLPTLPKSPFSRRSSPSFEMPATNDLSTNQQLSDDDASEATEVYSQKPMFSAESINMLNAKQRIHTTKLHYFDHPRLGVLVQVNKYELPLLEIPITESSQVLPEAPEAPATPENPKPEQP